ncbi:MAG: hypothetical protein LBS97_02120 [Treponema sp.]|jgi:hypothetical protein|nr:hypothetical protein [Treponema sp.]
MTGFIRKLICAVLCIGVLGAWKLSAAGNADPSTFYYVKANGNDAKNTGHSLNSPYKTLAKALSALKSEKKSNIVVIIGELNAASEGSASEQDSIFRIMNSGRQEIIIAGVDTSSKLSAAGTGKRVFTIDGFSNIRFENVVISGGKAIRGGGILAANNAVVTLGTSVVVTGNEARHGGGILLNGGVLTIAGGEVSGNRAEEGRGGGISVDGSGSVVMQAGKIFGNQAQTGGGIALVGSNNAITLTISGGEILSNRAFKSDGGGIFLSGGILTVTGGTIAENVSDTGRGGGVCVSGNGIFIMENGGIENNRSQNGGGGVAIIAGDTSVSFTFKNGRIANNESLSQNGGGGGILLSGGSLTISGGSITGNRAEGGGGVFFSDYGVSGFFDLSGGVISGNEASIGGGVIVYSSGQAARRLSVFSMSGGEITRNKAEGGAGIFFSGTQSGQSIIEMRGGTISYNISSDSGGGLSLYDGLFTFVDGSITGNQAGNHGGGVFVSAGTVELKGGNINENVSSGIGGGIALTDCTLVFTNGSVTGNQAQSGGGIYLNSSGLASGMTNGSISKNKATLTGGGLVVMRGSFSMSGGTVSGNQAKTGGGIATSSEGIFTKSSGIIYGRGTTSESNTADNNSGHAAYRETGTTHYRNSTVGTAEFFSSVNEIGWE